MSNCLEIDSVIKSFGQRTLLTDIYLQCQQGEIVGLLGRNGTGKSSLLKILFGTLEAEQKFIRINGHQVQHAYKTGLVHYLPQDPFLPKNLTIKQVVEYYLSPQQCEIFLEDEFFIPSEKIKNLSGGSRHYLEVKLLIYSNADYVLLDEPFQEISPIAVEKLKNEIVTQSGNKGIIVCDHQYRHVLEIAHRCYLLSDGVLRPIKEYEEFIRWGYLRK